MKFLPLSVVVASLEYIVIARPNIIGEATGMEAIVALAGFVIFQLILLSIAVNTARNL